MVLAVLSKRKLKSSTLERVEEVKRQGRTQEDVVWPHQSKRNEMNHLIKTSLVLTVCILSIFLPLSSNKDSVFSTVKSLMASSRQLDGPHFISVSVSLWRQFCAPISLQTEEPVYDRKCLTAKFAQDC